jgi:Bifunctional DNA primase/polymerase, N-terminal
MESSTVGVPADVGTVQVPESIRSSDEASRKRRPTRPWSPIGGVGGAGRTSALRQVRGSGIAVVDIDLPIAVASLDRLVEGQYELPRTVTGLTGGGGVHLIYRSRDKTLGNCAGRLPGIDYDLPGIDLRANGGYIVAP